MFFAFCSLQWISNEMMLTLPQLLEQETTNCKYLGVFLHSVLELWTIVFHFGSDSVLPVPLSGLWSTLVTLPWCKHHWHVGSLPAVRQTFPKQGLLSNSWGLSLVYCNEGLRLKFHSLGQWLQTWQCATSQMSFFLLCARRAELYHCYS